MSNELTPLRDDPYLGTVIQGKYQVRRKLGTGGMGTVYEGEHVLIGRRVAIKILHPQLSKTAEAVRRFQLEARAATAIGHTNIVEVTDMGQLDDGTVFMVLEYLEGRDLKAELSQSGPLPLQRAATIFAQICSALGAAHAKGIIHRDLKPENIYLIERDDEPDFVKVLDFGIAKFLTDDSQGSSLTQTGMAIGTAFYMSPEQAQGLKEVDHRSDLFSIGVMLYEALTNQKPFDHESQVKLMMSICVEAARPPVELRPDLPEGLQEVIETLMEKDPAHRYQDCAAVRALLMPWIERPTEEPSEEALAASEPPEPSSVPASAVTLGREGTRQSWHIPRETPPAEEPEAPAEEPADTEETTAREPAEEPADTEETTARESASEPKSTPQQAASSPGRRWLMPLLGAAVVFLAGIGAAAVMQSRVAPGETPEPRPPARSEPSNEAVQPNVRVQIEVSPHEAELFLDDEPVANPFDAQLPRQDEPRWLEARLAGHRTIKRQVSMRYAQKIRLEMAPLAVEADAGTAPTKRPPRLKVQRPTKSEVPAQAAPTPPEPAAEPPEPAAPTSTPEEERRQRLKRGVFEGE